MSARAVLSIALFLAWGLLVFYPPSVHAAGFSIQQVETHERSGQVLLSARAGLDLSPAALEALDHGVPLTLVFHVRVRRAGAWIWEDSLVDEQWRYVIRYRPLSERYEVYRLPGNRREDFVTRDAALRALSELNEVLIAGERLERGTQYELQLKVFLDIEELPLPLRPMAYLKPSWKLSSGWTKWPLRP